MSAGKGHTTRPFSWAKWDASKLWKKPNMTNTPKTDEILALLPGGQTCDPQAVADELRPAIAKMEMESYEWMDLIGSEVANLRAELAASVRLERERNDTANQFMRQARRLQAGLASERALADRLAGELEGCAELTSAHEALATYNQARNPAQTTGEGAE